MNERLQNLRRIPESSDTEDNRWQRRARMRFRSAVGVLVVYISFFRAFVQF